MESNNPFMRNAITTVHMVLLTSISNFDWPKTFRNKNANENCKLLTDTSMNIFRNYIPHKTKKLDYKAHE